MLFQIFFRFLVQGNEQAMQLFYPAFQKDYPDNLSLDHTFQDIQLLPEWYARWFVERSCIKIRPVWLRQNSDKDHLYHSALQRYYFRRASTQSNQDVALKNFLIPGDIHQGVPK